MRSALRAVRPTGSVPIVPAKYEKTTDQYRRLVKGKSDHVCETNCPESLPAGGVVGIRTRNLLIASPTP